MKQLQFSRRRVLATASGLGVSALVAPGMAWSADGHTLHTRLARDIKTFDPAFQSGNEHPIIRAVSTQLTTFGPDGSADTAPYGASSIEFVDATHVRFTLHPGIMWTGGYGPLTTEDVKYTFERAASEELESPWRDYWVVLDHVEVIDDLNGVIVLKEPFAPLSTISLPGELGNIVCKTATEEVGGTYTTDVPTTAGAYLVKEWVPQQRLVLEADPDWPLDKPQFTVVEYTVIEDAKVAELAFEAGELDYTQVSSSSLSILRDVPPEGSSLLERPSLTYLWLGMNVDHPTLADERVRKAIQYAIDVDQIIDGAYAGLALRANGIVPPSLLGHRDHSMIEKPDLEKARAYLADAGLADGLSVTLSIENVAERRAAAEIIQVQLAQIGINAEVLGYDSGTFWSLGVEADGDDWKDLQLFSAEVFQQRRSVRLYGLAHAGGGRTMELAALVQRRIRGTACRGHGRDGPGEADTDVCHDAGLDGGVRRFCRHRT